MNKRVLCIVIGVSVIVVIVATVAWFNWGKNAQPDARSEEGVTAPSGEVPQLAAPGEPLKLLSRLPERTLSTIRIDNADKSPKVEAIISPYGIYQAQSKNAQEIVVLIKQWRIEEEDASRLPNMTGRNVIMRVQLPENEQGKLMRGGTYQVGVELLVAGSTGIFAIDSVK